MSIEEQILHIPMRDGIELVASLWLPDDPDPVPLVLVRTPYRRSVVGQDFRNVGVTEHGYALVIQDARGTGDSPGQPEFFLNEADDGYDTIEWLATQPWCNGRVGMMGMSYHATAQWLAARKRPAHLRCIIPMSPAGNMPDSIPSLGGAFMPSFATFFSALHGMADPEVQKLLLNHRPLADLDRAVGHRLPMLRNFLEHPTLDDFWRPLRFSPADYADINIPVLTIAGWFDETLIGTTAYWEGLNAHSVDIERHLIIGPWTHATVIWGGETTLGDFTFGADGVIDVNDLHLWFLDRHLRGIRGADRPRARIFITGANKWRDLDRYPPPAIGVGRLYLHSSGNANSLEGDGWLDQEAPAIEPPDRYIFDPERPVLTKPDEVGVLNHRGRDQRYIEERSDVLVYTTAPLEEPLEIIGHVHVELHAATDGRDTDFTARLLDVLPDGRALQLGPWSCGGVIRARYRNGGEREELVTPDAVIKYRIDLRHIGHRFLPSHRVRIEISSSYAPQIRPNPNTGNPLPTDVDVRRARQTIHHTTEAPSALVFPVGPTGR